MTKNIDSLDCQGLHYPGLWRIFLLASILQGVVPIKFISIEVAPHPVVGESVNLRCSYDMEGAELYSVKWYKAGYEFYRYMPKDKPPAQMYNVPGTKVDLRTSDRHVVTLLEVDLTSSGNYRCEVSAEAPSFSTVSDEKEMAIINPPAEGPKITGGRLRYHVGDTVRVNCTSFKSKPAAILNWTINSKKTLNSQLREYPATEHEDGLKTSVLGLEFEVNESHFQNGEMRLRCSATIAPVYHKSNEEAVRGGNSNQQASVLESRDTMSQVAANRATPRPSVSQFLHLLHLLTTILSVPTVNLLR